MKVRAAVLELLSDRRRIEESDIAVMGFSAGGILSGEELLNYDGLVSPTGLDESYVPDALDEVSAVTQKG